VTSPGRVLVVGSINEDVVLRVARAPHAGETVTAKERTRHPGGKGANQAVAAARAGAQVEMVGRVGADAAGQRMIDALRDEGVQTDAIQSLEDVETGTAYITVADDGDNVIVVDPGANAGLSARDVEAHGGEIERADVMLAQLEIPIDSVAAALELARGAGTRLVLTLAPAQRLPSDVLADIDPLLVNQHEALVVLGEARDKAADSADAGDLARRLLDFGPRSAVITLGAQGAVYAHADSVEHLSACPVETVVDTTGAGDAFAGALAAALAHGSELADAVQAGLEAAAVTVTRAGAR
jgi:ribokinase